MKQSLSRGFAAPYTVCDSYATVSTAGQSQPGIPRHSLLNLIDKAKQWGAAGLV